MMVSAPPRVMTSLQGAIKNLNYPLPLPPESNQIWVITIREGLFVLLKVLNLDIAVSTRTGCHGDYLLILDGPHSYSDVITKLCQRQSHVGLVSSGQDLRIELHSEPFGAAAGQHTSLQAYYKARDVNECLVNNGGCAHACKNIFGSRLCGCRYGYRSIDFSKCEDIDECDNHNAGCAGICVNTEGSFYCACPEGYQLAPGNKTHCIDEDECSDPSKNSCEQVCVNIQGGHRCSCEEGFLLDEDGVSCGMLFNCSRNFTHEYAGVIQSPIIPDNIRTSVNCFWNIITYKDLTLTLRFLFRDWTPTQGCANYINITANQGAIRMREESFQICSGVLELADYHSDSDLLEMQFHSEWPHSSNFTLEYYTRENVIDWSKQCGGTLKGSGVLQSPGYPKFYPPNTKCLWQAVGAVKLKFHLFDLEREEGCLYDYLEVRDGEGVIGTNIRRFCGRKSPPEVLLTKTGSLFIEFRSDSSIQGRGFVAEFHIETI
ncbi:putative dorsal-ventral patterning tolloid-like protein 1 [Apostichopus japonicus]|uniref:Putative dorsal-ventral patterning tolloid-like protein 1 n=1 Tax=Stichopus japonicus TaxID=307972 RepID=A0A2G8LK86_STIJA|nr:putative dorsal-ventral patterning tolloid-like protein 1 [Apostichopus japonicus]